MGAGDTYQVAPGNFSFQVFVTTGGVRDLIANVQLNRSRFNASASIDAVDSLLTNVPEGDFTLTSGQTLGAFVRA
ncbi:hypothetical protein NIES593_22935 [Hydrococcus rivularis NIES-593]|uniref:Uncharacterized protein n=1 Tax=Hydrococcus rivularis NIES-593 TaxID=1921803 RepID=A0A1U7H6Z3_9CYAN|nr:hypothetical protein [Hydrococcus rivularis]OKH17637.1 hypothetical protein NIES593_22935 [Hydrococcus rivularis NIES-593]